MIISFISFNQSKTEPQSVIVLRKVNNLYKVITYIDKQLDQLIKDISPMLERVNKSEIWFDQTLWTDINAYTQRITTFVHEVLNQDVFEQ